MNEATYETLALTLSYVFMLAGVYIALRAIKMCRTDLKNARRLRKNAQTAGALGVLQFQGGEVRILREGIAGSGSECDARIKGLTEEHFHYAVVLGELRVTPLNGGEVITVGANETFEAGNVKIRFRLLKAGEALSPANANSRR